MMNTDKTLIATYMTASASNADGDHAAGGEFVCDSFGTVFLHTIIMADQWGCESGQRRTASRRLVKREITAHEAVGAEKEVCTSLTQPECFSLVYESLVIGQKSCLSILHSATVQGVITAECYLICVAQPYVM